MRLSDLDGIWDVGVDLAVDAMRDSLAVTLQQFEVSDAIAVTVRGVDRLPTTGQYQPYSNSWQSWLNCVLTQWARIR